MRNGYGHYYGCLYTKYRENLRRGCLYTDHTLMQYAWTTCYMHKEHLYYHNSSVQRTLWAYKYMFGAWAIFRRKKKTWLSMHVCIHYVSVCTQWVSLFIPMQIATHDCSKGKQDNCCQPIVFVCTQSNTVCHCSYDRYNHPKDKVSLDRYNTGRCKLEKLCSHLVASLIELWNQ